MHLRRKNSSKTMVLLVILALVALLAWMLWPVRIELEGFGIIQPRFENLVRVVPGESGMVCRLMTKRFQEVRAGEPLLEYVPAGKFSVLAYGSMNPPGGTVQEPETPPDWYQTVEHERVARIEAANRWSARVLSHGNKSPKWEHDLAQRLTMVVPLESDLKQAQAQMQENTRLGRENANKVYTFNEALGKTVPAEKGVPLFSPATGTLYSLWVQPRMQIFGAPAATLPAPVPGEPPSIALYASSASPVAEIMPSGAPLEVLALIPVPPRFLQGQERWQASLVGEEKSITVPAGAINVEIGRVSINRADADLIIPALSEVEENVFARLSISGNSSGRIGTVVRVRLVSPYRPRAWFWLRGEK